MIKTIQDYFKDNFRNNKGKIMKLEELPMPDSYLMIKDAKTAFVSYLVGEGTVKMYFGIQTNSNLIPEVKEAVGEVALFNPLKEKGPGLDLKSVAVSDDDDAKEVFNKAAKEALDKHKKEVKETTEKVELKIYKDEWILVPNTIDINEYQRILDKIYEKNNVYDEAVFVEII